MKNVYQRITEKLEGQFSTSKEIQKEVSDTAKYYIRYIFTKIFWG